MRKELKYIIFLFIGLATGLVAGFLLFKSTDNVDFDTPEKIIVEKVKTKVIKDTVLVNKTVKIKDTDTVALNLDSDNDSVYMPPIEDEKDFWNSRRTEDTTEEIILTERLVTQMKIPLMKRERDSTDVSELLGVKGNSFADEIIVEFWESPLNLTGYTLSRNSLKLFGFNPEERFILYEGNEKDQLIYDSETLSLILTKNKQFKTLRLK